MVLQGRQQAAARLPQAVIFIRTTWHGLSFTPERSRREPVVMFFP